MTDNDKRPFVSSYEDRHGKTRWRFRRAGKTVQLSGGPDHPAFEEEYQAAITGRPIERKAATVHKLSTAAVPHSLGAAWRILKSDTLEWKELDPDTQYSHTNVIERFLQTPVAKGQTLTFRDVAVADLRRKDIKKILADRFETPHAASHLLRVIRKLTGVALDQEWIENDPTYRLKYRPACKGWKAWPDQIRALYEKRWPIGSTPRLVYAIALYFGHRRSDVALTKWAHFEAGDGGAMVTQKKKRKGGQQKTLWIPIHPELAEVLAATPRKSEFVALSAFGHPFSPKALSDRMRDWSEAAGIPRGYTLHGLRKTLGKKVAEGGGTTRQTMSLLGHDKLEHAELYTRDAEQRTLAADGMRKVGSLKVVK